MKTTNENRTSPFDISKNFFAAKDIVSRRNQDGTVILMKLDNNNVFYKLDGIFGALWGFMQLPISFETMKSALQEAVSSENLNQQVSVFEQLILALAARELIVNSSAPGIAERSSEVHGFLKSALTGEYTLGQIKDFNIAQIESEVLNDSIYLDVFAGSDLALKRDISSIENALNKISSLEGVHFHWTAIEQESSRQTGVIAQQVAEVMPELVRRDQTTGNLAVNYVKMVPYLIESIKQLRTQVEHQAQQIAELQKRNSQLN